MGDKVSQEMQGAHKDELDPTLWELTGYKEGLPIPNASLIFWEKETNRHRVRPGKQALLEALGRPWTRVKRGPAQGHTASLRQQLG